ncbi:MAG TPA: hypothetical protein VGF67_12805 [Ktedonobacteraceae bacterium]
MNEPIERKLHDLEVEFGLSASEILDSINRRNRCKIAVRGAIAEAHLYRYLKDLSDKGLIDAFEDFDQDGHPDCSVTFASHTFLIECKNAEKEQHPASRITIDFQRTRNQKADPSGRFYSPDEFDIVAACLWNRTREWRFCFAATRSLPTHPHYPHRLSNHVLVDSGDLVSETQRIWLHSLPDLLKRLVPPHVLRDGDGQSEQ